MLINIIYFAGYREALGVGTEAYDLAPGADLLSLRAAIAERHGERSRSMLSDSRAVTAINKTVVSGQSLLHDQDEVAFFPPVTGG